jgi:hypothetical protein
MIKLKLPYLNEDLQYAKVTVGDVEYVNPMEHFASVYINNKIAFNRDFLIARGIPITDELLKEVLPTKARIEWQQKYEDIISTPLPAELLELLETRSKVEQLSILKSLSLNHEQLLSFIIKAGPSGYTYSQYHTMATISGSAALRTTKRSVSILKFLDKEETWMCFAINYVCPSEREWYKGADVRLSYTSRGFGLTRIAVLMDFRKNGQDNTHFEEIKFSLL